MHSTSLALMLRRLKVEWTSFASKMCETSINCYIISNFLLLHDGWETTYLSIGLKKIEYLPQTQSQEIGLYFRSFEWVIFEIFKLSWAQWFGLPNFMNPHYLTVICQFISQLAVTGGMHLNFMFIVSMFFDTCYISHLFALMHSGLSWGNCTRNSIRKKSRIYLVHLRLVLSTDLKCRILVPYSSRESVGRT